MKYLVIFPIPFLMTSCNIVDNLGKTGVIVLFIILLLASIGMFYYVAKKRKQAEQTANAFSVSVKEMLDKIEGTDKKIKALEHLLMRINEDEQYKKNTTWRDKVLSKVYQHMATVYFAAKNDAKVIETCSEVIRLEPSHMMSYYNRGTLYYNQGKYAEAEADLSSAIALDSSYADIYNNRGMVYEKLGELEKALTDFNYAIQVQPSPIAFYNRANTHTLLGDKASAETDYKTVLELDVEDEWGLKEHVELAIGKLK